MNMMQSEHRTDPGLATALRISVSRLARRLRVERAAAGLGEPDLSETQLAALATLERHGAMTPGELAEHEKVQPPSMTRVISALVESQLVRRAPHPSDRRQVVLTATEAGRDLVLKARQPCLAPPARLVHQVAACLGRGEHHLPAIGGMRLAPHELRFHERRNDACHGRRLYLLVLGQFSRRHGPVPLQRRQRGQLGF